MKKFLKVFSVVALICCCMFSFAGCDIFEDKKEEYAGLVAERKIVREVVDNAQAMLKSKIEEEAEPAPTGSDISAKALGADYWITSTMQHIAGIIEAIDVVISSSDFIPGKLRNAEIINHSTEGGGTTYYTYMSLNAYCGEDNMVTLNYSISNGYERGVVYATPSVANSIDIYYDNERQPLRFVECEAGGDYADFTDVRFAETSEFESLHLAQWSTNDYNGVVEYRRMVDVDKNGEVKDLEEQSNDPETECFTEEMTENFNAEIEFAKERTSLYNFARPLSKEVLDKFIEAMNKSQVE